MSDLDPCYFVDSNIWLYAFIQSHEIDKLQIARNLIQSEKERLVISTQVVNEVCINLLRKAGADEDTVQKTTRSFYSRYRVIESDELILLEASSVRQQFSMSYWDSLIVAAALATNATILYSEDMQHGQVINGRLTIQNPFFIA